jgi:protein-tyrosine phosphatase
MLPVTYRIEGPWSGQLAIIARPRGGEWLGSELCSLKENGFDVVLSLLTSEESEELGVSKEAQLSTKHGLEFLSFPIRDLSIPSSSTVARELLGEILNKLRAGKRIAVHCRQGIGRSGLVATSLLVLAGIDPSVAFRKVSAARGIEVPETVEQRAWVIELSHNVPELART